MGVEEDSFRVLLNGKVWVMEVSLGNEIIIAVFRAGFHIRSLNHMFDSHGKMDSTWPFHWVLMGFVGPLTSLDARHRSDIFLVAWDGHLLQKKGLRYERMLERCVAYPPCDIARDDVWSLFL